LHAPEKEFFEVLGCLAVLCIEMEIAVIVNEQDELLQLAFCVQMKHPRAFKQSQQGEQTNRNLVVMRRTKRSSITKPHRIKQMPAFLPRPMLP
jgi:hypothetical protein